MMDDNMYPVDAVSRATALEAGSAVLVIGAPPGSLRRSTWRPEWFAEVPKLGDGDQRDRSN